MDAGFKVLPFERPTALTLLEVPDENCYVESGMTTSSFLKYLRSLDVRLRVDGEQLHCDAPTGRLTPDLKGEIALRKPEILTFLRAGKTPNCVVPIQPAGLHPPLFAVPGHNGDVYCYVRLARHLGSEQPFYALEPPGLEGEQTPFQYVEELAAHFVQAVRQQQPEGPYFLAGYCAGGTIAFEMAQQLVAGGHSVELLALLEAPAPTSFYLPHRLRSLVAAKMKWLRYHVQTVSQLESGRLRYLMEGVGQLYSRLSEADAQEPDPEERVGMANLAAVGAYVPGIYPGQLTLIPASQEARTGNTGRQMDWAQFSSRDPEVLCGPPRCAYDTMLSEPHVIEIARHLSGCLEEAWTRGQVAGF